MTDVFICDYIRTPIGRYGGALSSVRADDLGAVPLRALLARNPGMDPAAVDEVIYGCANQAGEDNRNVARMSLLLAGLPETVPGSTVNRLCGSGMDAVLTAARAIAAGEIGLAIAGAVILGAVFAVWRSISSSAVAARIRKLPLFHRQPSAISSPARAVSGFSTNASTSETPSMPGSGSPGRI